MKMKRRIKGFNEKKKKEKLILPPDIT